MRATVFHLLVTTLVCISASSLPQPQQGPEIEKLVKAFSGTWSIVIKIEPNERLPKGGGGHGEETWRPGPAGLSLIEEYHSTGDKESSLVWALFGGTKTRRGTASRGATTATRRVALW